MVDWKKHNVFMARKKQVQAVQNLLPQYDVSGKIDPSAFEELGVDRDYGIVIRLYTLYKIFSKTWNTKDIFYVYQFLLLSSVLCFNTFWD